MADMKNAGKIAAIAALSVSAVLRAQQMTVKIIDRRTSDTNYTYQVPGHATSTTYGSANCNATSFGNSASANCSGSSTTSTLATAPHEVSFTVTGATFALLLPDGRIAVVNCASKFAERFAGPAGNKRSCRMPIVDEIQADFKGKDAKLEWTVSLDGKKKESESYRILGVLPADPSNAPSPASATTSAANPKN
ncbi:MAG: hypothetical protein ABSD98_09690 [Candidatus Korobacteraceae bacterium]|jgi:hypothetical protein